jgi:hypothetical protein
MFFFCSKARPAVIAMPDGNPQRDACRSWLHELGSIAMRSPFEPKAHIKVGVTPAASRRILDSLKRSEVTTHAVDCGGRPTRRLLIDGVTIEWLANDGRR